MFGSWGNGDRLIERDSEGILESLRFGWVLTCSARVTRSGDDNAVARRYFLSNWLRRIYRCRSRSRPCRFRSEV